ncbi:MAG: hypothetical protein AABW99_01920 [archaeon]
MIFGFMKGTAGGIAGAILGIGVVIIGILAIFLFAIIGSVIGAITGFILQIFPVIGPMALKGFMQFGIVNPNLAEIGAALGFVAGFFKQNFNNK